MNLQTYHSILPQSFFLGDDIVKIAKHLLGKIIVTNIENQITKAIIVETEAYRGPDDRACHAYNNLRTPRTQTMFEEGGIAYVYVCYGIHHMFNIVTSTIDKPHAILIRACSPLVGNDYMLNRRKKLIMSTSVLNGPGKLAQSLGISSIHNGCRLYKNKSPVWIENRTDIHPSAIVEGLRVGFSKTAGVDAFRPWRFSIKNNRFVSNPKKVSYPDEWKNI